jgi:hypothetical protein
MTTPRLLALSDLHVAHPQNREIVAGLRPGSATISPSRRVSETPSSTGRERPSGVVNVLVTPRASRITSPLKGSTSFPPGDTASATAAG